MKKVLYMTPAFAVCMVIGTLGVLFGFGHFTWTAWSYLGLSVLGSGLLCGKKWWGGLVGAATGGIIIWMDVASTGTGVRTADLGIVFVIYYLIMALVCYRAGKQ